MDSMVEYILRAAFARAFDQEDWEHDELRRKGLGAVELFHNGRAVWEDRPAFERARREFVLPDRPSDAAGAFETRNELAPEMFARLDRDLSRRWRQSGYLVYSLTPDMKRLFKQLEDDLRARVREAREDLVGEILQSASS
ncbi:MAG TPA: hypothetical protein VIJ77_11720 [Candidatus Tumulicola sp.]